MAEKRFCLLEPIILKKLPAPCNQETKRSNVLTSIGIEREDKNLYYFLIYRIFRKVTLLFNCSKISKIKNL